ncbi:MAG: leucyl aminopeptidase [Candidatus Competibacterales bacterium]|nr:leucyl aminopeptidase [Candidatus Competibacterales bacterium]
MEFVITSGHPAKQSSDCLVVGVFEERQLSSAAQRLDEASDGRIAELLQRGDLGGKSGQSLLLYDAPGSRSARLLLVGCGKPEELDARRYRQIIGHAAKALQATGAESAAVYLTTLEVQDRDERWNVRQAAEGLLGAGYRFTRMKSKSSDPADRLQSVTFAVSRRKTQKDAEQAVTEARAITAGSALARDLGNLPGNVCTPRYLAGQAEELAKQHKKLKTRILEPDELEKLGAGSLLSVARGSEEPARLIVMEYRNGPKKQAPVVLVGKGITFDTGGISIKPAAAMDEMKFDMCGAASVFGTVKACAELALPLNLVGIVAAAENMPGGRATKPGDIVTSLSGQTVEILNTDAEGRLVLCDALTYSERYEPDVVIDIATLTGACVIALGNHPHGVFSNDAELAQSLLAAGDEAFDRGWQMPLWEDYQEALDSNFADMANVGGREGGAITAACFLWRFARKLRWAHLDIAGTAWLSGKQKGATGRPVPLLTQFLLDRVARD